MSATELSTDIEVAEALVKAGRMTKIMLGSTCIAYLSLPPLHTTEYDQSVSIYQNILGIVKLARMHIQLGINPEQARQRILDAKQTFLDLRRYDPDVPRRNSLYLRGLNEMRKTK